MADEAATAEVEGPAEEKKTEETVPYDRFQQANKKARDAADRAKALEKDVADLKTQVQEREQAGLPELDRLKKDIERLSKRAEEAEAKAAEADTKLARSAKERWVIAAAKDFADPSDAAVFVNLDEIEDERERQAASAEGRRAEASGPRAGERARAEHCEARWD